MNMVVGLVGWKRLERPTKKLNGNEFRSEELHSTCDKRRNSHRKLSTSSSSWLKVSDFSKPCTVVESQFIGILRFPSVEVASFHGQQQRRTPTHPELVQLSTGGEITRRFIKETSWTWSTSEDKKKDAHSVVEIWKYINNV